VGVETMRRPVASHRWLTPKAFSGCQRHPKADGSQTRFDSLLLTSSGATFFSRDHDHTELSEPDTSKRHCQVDPSRKMNKSKV
jgi:hypothetical protein